MELVRRFLKYDFDKGVAGHNWCWHSNCKAHDLLLGLGFRSDTTLQEKKKLSLSWMCTAAFLFQLT